MRLRTVVCIAGGGPAGVMLGLLLAQSGVEVVVLEKHQDFFRDFRGDTINPSTLDVLGQLGLGDRLAMIPHTAVHSLDALEAIRTQGLPAFRAAVVGAVPFLEPSVDALTDWEQVTLLSVQINRHSRWHQSGLLHIDDDAHPADVLLSST